MKKELARVVALVPQEWADELMERADAAERSMAGEIRLAIRQYLGVDEPAKEAA